MFFPLIFIDKDEEEKEFIITPLLLISFPFGELTVGVTAGPPQTLVRQFLSINGEILLSANRDGADLGAAV